jgi:predicted DNA-binding transcriptional regulator AlpA
MDKNLPSFNLSISELETLITDIVGNAVNSISKKTKKVVSNTKLYTLKEVTQIFKISKTTLYKWIGCKVLPNPLKIGGRIYFRKSEIDEMYLSKHI